MDYNECAQCGGDTGSEAMAFCSPTCRAMAEAKAWTDYRPEPAPEDPKQYDLGDGFCARVQKTSMGWACSIHRPAHQCAGVVWQRMMSEQPTRKLLGWLKSAIVAGMGLGK